MNAIKYLFITPYIMFNLVGFIYGILLALGGNFWSGGYVLATAPIIFMTLGNLLFHHSSTTKRYLPIPTTLVIVGVALVLTGDLISQKLEATNLVIGGLIIALFFVYTVWYSGYGRKKSPVIRNANTIYPFLARDLEGNLVSPQVNVGSPAIYLFYRGNWCPFCVTQIEQMVASYKELEARGIKVVFVSSQPVQSSRDLAQKFDVPVQFWVDDDNKAAKELGILDKRGLPIGFEMLGYQKDTVMATILMTDRDGTLIYNDQTDSYRVRPEPKDLLRAFDEYQATGIITGAKVPEPNPRFVLQRV